MIIVRTVLKNRASKKKLFFLYSNICYFLGVRSVEFSVDIIYNSDTEWHESFYIVLDQNSLRGAEAGDIVSTTVTILDDEVSGSLVLPAPPMVNI